jgi:thiaminase
MPLGAAESLTEHLVSLHSTPRPYSAATEHPFLSAAGNGTLSDPLLALWLSQDRIYAAHAYPRFIGLLISKIPFSSSDALDSTKEKHNQKVLKILAFSLENVVREAAFFKDTSQKWGLDMECWKERKATRDYTAEMARVSSYGSLKDGVIFLWAMEKASTWSSELSISAASLQMYVNRPTWMRGGMSHLS